MHRNSFEFDLITQRFLKNRWDTKLGQTVFKEVIDRLKNGVDVRAILDKYVLVHPDNQDPYGHPFYPKDAMKEGDFWVLSNDDLRGIQVYNETFPKNATFSKKVLDYSCFYNCQLTGINMERSELTMAMFEKCHLEEVSFSNGGGYGTCFLNSNLQDASFWNAGLIDTNLSGTNMSGIYLESAKLENLIVNYATQLDETLTTQWHARKMARKEMPDHFKAFRIAFEKAELWQRADKYLYLERKANRKFILKSNFDQNKTPHQFYRWMRDFAWDFSTGYGTKPSKILLLGVIVSLIYAFIFFASGNPGEAQEFTASLYFSFTTFATLGYGDLSYTKARWIMRLISTSEAWLGAVLIATYVAVLGRKVIRH